MNKYGCVSNHQRNFNQTQLADGEDEIISINIRYTIYNFETIQQLPETKHPTTTTTTTTAAATCYHYQLIASDSSYD